MKGLFKLEIKPQNQIIEIEMDLDTSVSELLDYIQIELKINSDTKRWTCYSKYKQMYLEHTSRIGNAQYDQLTINTIPNERSQQNTPSNGLIQTLSGLTNNINQQQIPNQVQQQVPPPIQRQQFPPPLFQQQQIQNQQQFYNQQQPQQQQQPQYQNQNQPLIQDSSKVQNQSQKVNINFQIIDGNIKRQFQSIFNQDDKLDNLADAVLAYLGVTKEIASCDLIIFSQSYNDPIKREKTLHQLSIKNEVTIEARLRWIGGMQY